MTQLQRLHDQKPGDVVSVDKIEADLDQIYQYLNSGISSDGIQGLIGEDKLITLTINQLAEKKDVGKYSEIINAIITILREVKGSPDWKDPAVTSLQYLLDNKTDVGHAHGGSIDGHTHNEFVALDMLGVTRSIITNMTVNRDGNKKITDISYVNAEESGDVKFHRNPLGKLDCTRLSNSVGIKVQIELIRGADGLVSGIYRGGFNTTLQSGLIWPI